MLFIATTTRRTRGEEWKLPINASYDSTKRQDYTKFSVDTLYFRWEIRRGTFIRNDAIFHSIYKLRNDIETQSRSFANSNKIRHVDFHEKHTPRQLHRQNHENSRTNLRNSASFWFKLLDIRIPPRIYPLI